MSDINIGQLPSQQFFSRVIINGQEIASNNIINLTIREWVLDILPKIEISIADFGALIEVVTLNENDEIEVFLGKHLESNNILHMVFQLSDFNVTVMADNRMLLLNIVGYLKVDDMFILKNRRFAGTFSKDVLNQIATETGLEFYNKYNINTNDQMTWLQVNSSNYNFVKHVLKRSYIANDVVFGYADHTNRFIFTSLNREIDNNNYKVAKFNVKESEFKTDSQDNNIYYNAYDVVNLSGHYNKITGYGVKVDYYDLEIDNSITYNTINKISDSLKTFIKTDTNGTKTKNIIGGSFNDLNLYSDKYYETMGRNEFLINSMFGFSIAIQIDAEEDINLFDKIQLVLPSLVSEFNDKYSGFYLVGGIIHTIDNGGIYRKCLSLHTNGRN